MGVLIALVPPCQRLARSSATDLPHQLLGCHGEVCPEATIAALQTEVAGQRTEVANLREELAIQRTAVADLRSQVAPGEAEPSATPKADSNSGKVLYEADQSGGFEEWSGTPDWQLLDGMLINDGSLLDYDAWLAAPYVPGDIANYAVEAEIQYLSTDDYMGFGFVLRADDGGGYWVGEKCGMAAIADGGNPFNYCQFLDSSVFDPGTTWHRYRAEAKDNTIKLMVDDLVVAEVVNNRFLAGGRIGLFSMGAQVSVRSFKVTAL